VADHDINCRELVDLTGDYLEAAMDTRRRTTFEQHLVFCDYCVVHLGQVRSTKRVLAGLEPPPVPPEIARALAAALAERRG
jgi:hypothetical protein